MSLIQLRNVSKMYKLGNQEVKALDDVNLNVERGDFIAILGPSGSGKSTLMNIIGCLDIPSSGEYILGGREVSSMSDEKLSEIRNRNVGFIFQGFNLVPTLTAAQNVELPLLYRGEKSYYRKKKSIRALDKVGLLDRAEHLPSQMSGGQQQRVSIARAIASSPYIILADEPTGNLDSKSGNEVINILKSLNSDGTTVVLITHDNNIASSIDKQVTIRDGRLVEAI